MIIEYIPIEQLQIDYKRHCKVYTEGSAYKALVKSIKEKGMLNPIMVEPKTRYNKYVIIDGAHRFTAGCECKLLTIPCVIGTN